jgi:hypothetical protein
MQLAFEHVSPDASRLSFHERTLRVREPARAGRPALPHVDDVMFALALVGLLALGGAELRDGVDYAFASPGSATSLSAAAPSRTPG